jgi:hypothetical protein
VLLMGEVVDGVAGLEFYGVIKPPSRSNWRQIMPALGRTFRGLAVRGLLARFLTPSDRDDLADLLDLYPGHVIEFSACDRPAGVLPHRRAVIWEVRAASGDYERAAWGHHAATHSHGPTG